MEDPQIIKQMRRIVTNHQYEHVDNDENKAVIDVQTANIISKVYDALNDTNKKKFSSLPIDRMAIIAWDMMRVK